MSVITEIYRKVGTQLGMPVFEQSGICTDEASAITTLRADENGRVELIPLPRRSGLAAKALDNTAVNTVTLDDPAIGGSHDNCMQIGRTTFERFAPEQDVGPYSGHEILSYRRIFIQLES